MSRAPRRVRRLVAVVGAAAVAGFTVSACAPTHAGAAATVGGQRITDNQVAAAAKRQLTDSNTHTAAQADTALKRSVLSEMIDDRLIAHAAQKKGVTVSEGDIQSSISSQGGASKYLNALAVNGHAIAATDLHDAVYYGLLAQKLTQALTADITLPSADLRIILATDKATADSVLAQAKANPSQFAALAGKYSQDQNSAANGGDIGQQRLDQLPEPLKSDIAGKSAGDIFEEQIQSQYYVIQVVSIGSVALKDLDPQTASQLQQQALVNYVQSATKDLPISVSPRYGTWNATNLQVVASTGALSSPEPTAPAALPSAPPSAPPSPAAG